MNPDPLFPNVDPNPDPRPNEMDRNTDFNISNLQYIVFVEYCPIHLFSQVYKVNSVFFKDDEKIYSCSQKNVRVNNLSTNTGTETDVAHLSSY